MVNTCIALFKKEQEEKAVKLYYAECLRLICENTAKLCNGGYITKKLSEVLDPKPVDTRTTDEIVGGIKEKLNKMK